MSDDLPFDVEPAPQMAWATPKCSRHTWGQNVLPGDPPDLIRCRRCHHVQDPAKVRMGRTSRNRGNRNELTIARQYGGEKIGHRGGPGDVLLPGRDAMFIVQVKTHRSPAPKALMTLFDAMAVSAGGRIPVVLHRYLRPGQRSIDVFVIRGDDWIALHGATPGGEEV